MLHIEHVIDNAPLTYEKLYNKGETGINFYNQIEGLCHIYPALMILGFIQLKILYFIFVV
jgi:hypothetical protein